MKTNKLNTTHGFTLIEMVGVLAVIAILAALLVPKIFAAINDSRFSNTVASLNSVKTASMDYFGKKGNFPATDATFDKTLVTENCLERPLACKLAETSANAETLALVTCADLTAVTTAIAANGGAYALDGTAPITGSEVVQCKLVKVAMSDAYELSRRMDGPDNSEPDLTKPDSKGRVVYAVDATGTTVYVYVAHK